MKALFDTNILIDYLNGIEAARTEIARYDKPLISTITWMEVLVGCEKNEDEVVRRFLANFNQIAIDSNIAEIAVTLRRNRKIRLPDAIIWVSAQSEDALLVSRNTKDFPADEPGIRMPYTL